VKHLLLATICLMLVGGGVEQYAPPRPPAVKPAPFHLPTHCQPLYGQAGNEWADCMGVGFK